MQHYYRGYAEARARAEKADLEGLLDIIDTLYGRSRLEYGTGIEEVRREALSQIECEFRKPTCPYCGDRSCGWRCTSAKMWHPDMASA